MVDSVGALQAAATGLRVVKELNQINKSYDEAAQKLKIAELLGALAAVQIALAEAQAEVAKKNAQIAKLEQNFKRKNEHTVEVRGFLYRKGHDGKPEGLPFCPRCLDKGIMMMVATIQKPGRPQVCPECKSEYHAAEYTYRGD